MCIHIYRETERERERIIRSNFRLSQITSYKQKYLIFLDNKHSHVRVCLYFETGFPLSILSFRSFRFRS